MGKSVSLATLRSDVRFEIDLDASSSRVSDAQLDRVINRARDELFLYLLDCSANYMDAVSTVNTQAGVSFVSVPSRFYALTSLRLIISDECKPVLYAAKPDEIRYDTEARTWDEHSARPVYWLAQGLIYFWPVPAGVYTLDVAYVEAFEDLVAAGDTWDCMPGWDEWVVVRSVMRLQRRQKDAEQFQLLAAELNRLSQQIESALSGRDRASPPMARRIAHNVELYPRTGRTDYEGGY